ncbi:MAG: hypothetical protein KatS3mg006_0086 [Pyrinomonadaceae bacterium]|nr:MAG: hypothetical protein KatS3mg006_0086 [Pyrinomonadaceae bacterium]
MAGSMTLKEIIGNNNAGSMMSPVGAAQAPQPIAGKVGGAIDFVKFFGSGLTGAVVGNMQGPLVFIGSADFSIDAWVKFPPTANSGGKHWIINKYDAPQKRGYALYIVRPPNQSASYLEFLWGDGNNFYTVQSSAPLSPNQWHFVAVTFQRPSTGGASVLMYVNGAPQGSQTLSGTVGSLQNNISIQIGYQPSSVDEPIAIDELEIFNRALTQQEIQAIYNAGPAGKCKPGQAKICVQKFKDLNGNGTKDTNEPGLGGWKFNVTPAPLPPTTSPVTTGPQGSICFGVSAPGTYTITEVVQSGWTPTTPNPQTVTVAAGQTANVVFGNKQQGCVQAPSDLVAWYWMDGNANDTAALGGFQNPSATNAISFVAGKVGQGVTFGTGGYIDIPHSSALANQQFTVDAWVYPQGPGPNNDFSGSVIVQKAKSPPSGYTDVPISLAWSANVSGQPKFVFTFGHQSTERIVSTANFPPGQWYHVAATYDGGTFKLYVNGALEGSMALTKTITYDPAIPWTIGSAAPPIRAANYPRTFNGVIDEVEIFNRALTQAEIQAIYNAGSYGKCKPQPFNPTTPNNPTN